MSRHGKIARLPLTLRETLNQRLENNEPAEPLLAWLNPLPEVQAILQDQFAGVPISKQNLHEWRSGGFREWELKRDLKYDAEETKADGTELDAVTDGHLADHLATVLTARYASLIRRWTGETTEEFRAQLKVLRALIQDVSLLRRWDHSAAKVWLAEGRLEDERFKYHRQEMAELEQKEERERNFMQALESLGYPSRAEPRPPKPTRPTQPKHTSHNSPASHPSHPTKSPASPPIKAPVAASRQSAADLPKKSPESNPDWLREAQVNPRNTDSQSLGKQKVSQSTFSTPAVENAPGEATPHRDGDSLSPPPEAKTTGQSNPVQASQSDLPTINEVPSPCVGICQRDGGGYCTGCLRSVPEITRWPLMPPEQKRQCLEHLAARRRRKERGE